MIDTSSKVGEKRKYSARGEQGDDIFEDDS